MKQNADWEASHIVNRKRPMILFGFEEKVKEILRITWETEDIQDAVRSAEEMNMIFPKELFEDKTATQLGEFIKVEALCDGTWVPRGTPFAQISNIEKGCGELVTWFEGLFLQAYFMSACATRALDMRKYLESRNERLTRFHSFGFRGHRTVQEAYDAARGWSLFLPGTDDFIVKTTSDVLLNVSSIPAEAHKVVQNWDSELMCHLEAVRNAARLGYKAISILIDTEAAHVFIDRYLLKVQDMAMTYGIKPIYRPDSGTVMHQAKDIVTKLRESGYQPNNVDFGIIIGDDMDFEQAMLCDSLWTKWNFPTDMLTYGMGGGFYKDLDRDYLGWSMKTCYSNGKPRMKKTDFAFKRSILGTVRLDYLADGNLMCSKSRFRDDRYNSEYHIIDPSKGPTTTSFHDIQDIALSQNTSQKEILFHEILQDEMAHYNEATADNRFF